MSHSELLQRAATILEQIISEAPACSCGHYYTKRQLIAPDCARCNGPDLDDAIAWLSDYRATPPTDLPALTHDQLSQYIAWLEMKIMVAEEAKKLMGRWDKLLIEARVAGLVEASTDLQSGIYLRYKLPPGTVIPPGRG